MNKTVFFVSQAGCFLPFLILLNFIFGWMFFKPLAWLGIEVVLILIFFLNSYIVLRKISSLAKRRNKVVDVKGEIVEDIENKKIT